MPKKYKQKSLLTKPTSSAPSNLALSRTEAVQDAAPKRTVNDLIRESRQSNASDHPASTSAASSIPPSLRAVLDMPAPPPPAPRLGMRGPQRLRRIPGPPPPRSWLTDSIHAPKDVRNVSWSKAHERTRIQAQSSILPDAYFPPEQSLQHLIMKRMATNWSWHCEYDHEYLAELPPRTKQILLSYIAIYNEGHGPNPLRYLFPPEVDPTELYEVRRLDLGNAIGGWSTVRMIGKELDVDKTSPSPKQKQKRVETVNVDLPDAWDEDDTQQLKIHAPLSNGTTRFRNLKHLSLAIVPNTKPTVASWAGLLSLVSKLSTITSLSLAYWPQPTYTPNASTIMAKVAHTSSVPAQSVNFGGTNFYSAFDNDWREAAGILRSLSRSLYCLKWLDLTGCGDWFDALTWQPLDDNEEAIGPSTSGPDWNGSWRDVEHLILRVGWTPGPLNSLLYTGTTSGEQLTELRSADDEAANRMSEVLSRLSLTRLGTSNIVEHVSTDSWDVEEEREKYYHRKEVAQHTEISFRARAVAQHLRALRKEHSGRWLNVDFGIDEPA